MTLRLALLPAYTRTEALAELGGDSRPTCPRCDGIEIMPLARTCRSCRLSYLEEMRCLNPACGYAAVVLYHCGPLPPMPDDLPL